MKFSCVPFVLFFFGFEYIITKLLNEVEYDIEDYQGRGVRY